MTEASKFSWPYCIATMILTLVCGSILTVIVTMLAATIHGAGIGMIAGLAPGALIVLAGTRASKDGFGQGLIIGGCILALAGGTCGTILLGR